MNCKECSLSSWIHLEYWLIKYGWNKAKYLGTYLQDLTGRGMAWHDGYLTAPFLICKKTVKIEWSIISGKFKWNKTCHEILNCKIEKSLEQKFVIKKCNGKTPLVKGGGVFMSYLGCHIPLHFFLDGLPNDQPLTFRYSKMTHLWCHNGSRNIF